MPRAARGSNRTDLPGKAPEAITTVPGQAYGNVTAQRQAQKILPIAAGPVAAGGPSPAPAGPQAGPNAAAGPPTPTPGDLAKAGTLKWTHPSDRPNEPVTHGLETGPGGGPEVLPALGQAAFQAQQDSTQTTGSLLKAMALKPGASSVIKTLAANAS